MEFLNMVSHQNSIEIKNKRSSNDQSTFPHSINSHWLVFVCVCVCVCCVLCVVCCVLCVCVCVCIYIYY